MKVAFIFLHSFSESMGSVVRVRELALSLEKFGVEVFIITPFEQSFNLSTNVHVVSIGGVFGFSKGLYKLLRGLYYNRIFPVLFSKNLLRSSMFLRGLLRKIVKFLQDNRVDIVQVEQDFALPIGASLKEITGLPVIADLHNISTEELVSVGLLERRSNYFLDLQHQISDFLRKVDRVIVVSELMKDYVVNNYSVQGALIDVVPPGGRVYANYRIVENRVKPFKVVYAGLVAHREHVDLFVRSMPFLKGFNYAVHFYITNKGEGLKEIKELARNLGVCPSFFWFKDYKALNSFLSTCHVGVLPSSNDIARKMGTPVKLFNYMSVGLPVVANDIGGWSKIIDNEKVGLLTSDDPESFASAINTLLTDEKLRIELSYKALETVRNKYNWDVSTKRLFKVYESFL